MERFLELSDGERLPAGAAPGSVASAPDAPPRDHLLDRRRVVVFLVISALLARALSVGGAEDSATHRPRAG